MKSLEERIYLRVILSIMTILNVIVIISGAPLVVKVIVTVLLLICAIIGIEGFMNEK
ncbi:MAG: hypothetical protein RSB87_04215 [Clostridia bacterium]